MKRSYKVLRIIAIVVMCILALCTTSEVSKAANKAKKYEPVRAEVVSSSSEGSVKRKSKKYFAVFRYTYKGERYDCTTRVFFYLPKGSHKTLLCQKKNPDYAVTIGEMWGRSVLTAVLTAGAACAVVVFGVLDKKSKRSVNDDGN